MTLQYNDILLDIQNKINAQENKIDLTDFGVIIEVADGIAKVIGLNNCSLYDIVKTDNNIGMIMKIDTDIVHVVFFKKDNIVEGEKVVSTKQKLNIQVDEYMLGQIINPLGEFLMEDFDNHCKNKISVNFDSATIIERSKVNEPLLTGIQLIDALIPIGLGQKQLILGDKQTGKTSICIDAIINQARLRASGFPFAYCIYVAIGKKASEIVSIYETLKKYNALSNTIIVATTASDTAAMQYISTETGAAIANYFCINNKNALVVFDDLTKHADAYREISLLMRKTPTRGAYPGDIFYLHAKLLEKATKMKTGGSITMLPIIETLEGDVSDYIPTNVISITDGQIYLDKDLFLNNQKPAINIGLSVSRIGSSAQHINMSEIVGNLKGELSQYIEYEKFSKSISEIDENTQSILNQGRIFMKSFQQKNHSPVDKSLIILTIMAIKNNLIKNSNDLSKFHRNIIQYFENNHQDLLNDIVNNVSIKSKYSKILETLVAFMNKEK